MTTFPPLQKVASSSQAPAPAVLSEAQESMEGIERTPEPEQTIQPKAPIVGDAKPGTVIARDAVDAPSTDGENVASGSDIHVYGPAATPSRSDADLPDSFFEPGLSDVQAHHASVLARSNKLNNAPLLTAKHRDKELAERERKKADKWPNTTIRIKFSDGTIVEKVFASTSPIQPVYEFVRSTLDSSAVSQSFVLWQPPRTRYPEHPVPAKPKPAYQQHPKIVTPANYGPVKGGLADGLQGGTGGKETLFQLGLVPQSVLLVKWDEEGMNASGYPAPLKEELKTTRVPLPPAQGKEPGSSGGAGAASGAPGEKKEKKIPKWLQKGLMKKK